MKKAAVLIATLFLLSFPLSAQDYLGKISGQVVDESGGLIPGADLTARNESTGVETSTVSSDSGVYTFQSLLIGSYTVTASLAGFKTVEHVGVRVVSSATRTLNLTLPVGEVVDTVTVEGAALAVDSSSSSAGVTRVVEEIGELPLAVNGGARHSLSFARTLPGLSYTPYGLETTTTDMGSINGVMGSVSMNIDGMASSPKSWMGMREDSGLIPETISEFRMSSNPNAEHGWNLGSGVEMVMKSGTNDFHGTLFHYLRNEAVDARNFFASDVSPHKQNEFGAVVGGPVIPDRHFFLASYTGFRERRESGGSSASVPTATMKSGDLSEFLGPQIGTDVLGRPILQGQVYDPMSTRPDGFGGFIRDPFPGNIIPSNRISSISSAFQAGYPAPTQAGLQNNWVGSQVKAAQDIDKLTVKTDHEMTDKWKFSFGMDWHRKDVVWPGNGGDWDPRITTTHEVFGHQYRYRFNNYFTLRPNLLLSVRFAGNRVPREIGKIGNTHGADSGITGVLTPDTPFTNIQGNTGFGFLFLELWQPGTSFPGYVDLSWAKGNHNYKFGVQFRQQIVTHRHQIYTNGNWSFNNISTGLASGNSLDGSGNVVPFPDVGLTGRGYASFLLGEVDGATLNAPNTNRFNARTYAIFLQDSWRATPKLTVNYGFRYAWWTPFGEGYDRMGWFDPTISNPGAGGRLGALSFQGEGPGRTGRTRAFDKYWGGFGPRLGLAYALDDKTVARAYYGMSYADPTSEMGSGGAIPRLGWQVTVAETSLDGGVTPAFNWNDGFPPIGLETIRSLPNTDPTLVNGGSAPWFNPADNKWIRTHNLGFGLEREVGWNLVIKADYVGKLGRHFRQAWDRNQVPVSIFGLGPVIDSPLDSPEGQATGIQSPYEGFSGSVRQASRPYPQYSSVTLDPAHAGSIWYHGLNFSGQKRFGQGFTFLLAYTLSKNVQSGEGTGRIFGPPRVPHEGYGGNRVNTLTFFDRTHNFALTWTYELPFGRGQRWGGGASGVANQIIGGWRLMGWHNYMSGKPIALARVNRTGAPVDLNVGHRDYDPNGSNKNIINVNAFSPENRFVQFGDTAQLVNVRHLGYSVENFSILKDFQITENWGFLFGAEFFNAFNRPQFHGGSATGGHPGWSLADPEGFGRYGAAALPRIIQFRFNIKF